MELITLILFFASLAIILLSCELFTNGIEWVGCKLKFSESVTGSVLAAIGTALPETLIPMIAILLGTEAGHEIGIGAILGAPFMLATLAMFIGGATILIASNLGVRGTKLELAKGHAEKDLRYFLIVYVLALVSSLIAQPLRYAVAVVLILAYLAYLRELLKSEGTIKAESCPPLYFARILGIRNSGEKSMALDLAQVALALLGIIAGAKIFVGAVESISQSLGISPFVLSFLIAPIATELPEKFNSVMWYWRKKDTLALGNITGAMVFQSSVPVSIGILMTSWDLQLLQAGSVIFALLGACTLYASIHLRKSLDARVLLFGGVLYAGYVLFIFAIT